MKYVLLIGDGMADDPVDALGGRTPLEKANKPCMDALANKATECGNARTVPPGVAPGSDTAILSILGYDPRHFHAGRSPFEAAGSGIALSPGEVSYRCNMVALEDNTAPYEDKKLLSHNGGSVAGHDATALMASLLADSAFAGMLAGLGMHIHVSPSFRHIAVQKTANLTGLQLLPPHDHLGETLGGLLPQGSPLAEALCALMYRAHTVLNDHPVNEARRKTGKLAANGLWFWAEGTALDLPGFHSTYGKKGFVVSAVPLVRGIGRLGGLDSIPVEGATGELETHYEGKALAVAKGLHEGGYDFAVLHVEAPDECTHNGDLAGKIQAIEWIDSRTLAPLVQALDNAHEAYRLLVLSDHKTLTRTRGHDGSPVPYFIYDSRQNRQQQRTGGYTEAVCAKGTVLEDGFRLMEHLFETI